MEIERKFLTPKPRFSLEGYEKINITQGYIAFEPAIRIRKSNDEYWLTVKGKGHVAREEFELPITCAEYESLLKKTEGETIYKTRYIIPLEGGNNAELDVYEGRLSGLYTTEVEFPTEEAAKGFTPPAWLGKDVSEDKRYKNTYLSLYGMPREKENK